MTVQEADKKRWGGGHDLPTISFSEMEKTMREI